MREHIDFTEAPYCSVGNSKICKGQGLFALKRFAPNEIVVDYSLSFESWRKCPFKEIPKEYADCLWWVGEDSNFCRLSSPSSLFMRANHSFNCNTDWNPVTKQLIAKHTIFPGEEITFDYTKEIASEEIKSAPPLWLFSIDSR